MDESVIRGLPVEGPPFLLRRSSDVQQVENAGERVERVYREAASAGFAEGLHQGHQEGAAAGYEEGVRRGREDAERKGIEETARAVSSATSALLDERARLASIAASWDEMRGDVVLAAEDDMVAMCYEVVCRIVGAGALLPEAVHAAFVQVTSVARDEPRVVLRVHPEDAALLDRVGLAAAVGQSISWRADAAVALGGCILESRSGGLDARLEILLEGCKAALLTARDERAEDGWRAGTTA